MDCINSSIKKDFSMLIKNIEEHIGAESFAKRKQSALEFIYNGNKALYRCSEDKLFLYILLCLSLIENNPTMYNPSEFARIYPVFFNLAKNWKLGERIKNFDDKFSTLCKEKNNDQIDATIFEILTAFKYQELGYNVEFIKESPMHKTPDLSVEIDSEKYYIECKKMRRGNEYTYEELEKWYDISSKFVDFVGNKKFCGHIHFKFRSELSNINTKKTVKKVLKQLIKRNINKPFRIAKNKDFKITFTPINENKFNTDLDPLRHFGGPTFVEYLTGEYNYRYMYKFVHELSFENGESPMGYYPYVSQVKWGTVLSCHSASREASTNKAQHLKRILAGATEQLAAFSPGIVHVLVEDAQDHSVFENRCIKNIDAVENFTDPNNSLKYIFIHYAKHIIPIDRIFDVEETVQSFNMNYVPPKTFPQIWYPAEIIEVGYGSLLYDY